MGKGLSMKLDIFGRMSLEVKRSGQEWQCFLLGEEGKKRKAREIHIPSSVKDDDVIEYLEDLLHEWATPEKSQITKL